MLEKPRYAGTVANWYSSCLPYMSTDKSSVPGVNWIINIGVRFISHMVEKRMNLQFSDNKLVSDKPLKLKKWTTMRLS